MAALVVPGPAQPPPGAMPKLLGRYNGTASSHTMTFTNGTRGLLAVVTHCDATFTGVSPIQTFFNLVDEIGCIPYWDSQSTGEGNGVTYSWRGMYWVEYTGTFAMVITAAGAGNMSMAMHGWYIRQQF